MKQILQHLYKHGKLSKSEAKDIATGITEGKYDNFQIASFLTVFNMRPIDVDELDGFREAMLEKCIKLDLRGKNCLDIVGTGGDGKDTFNISTLSSVVIAGAGIKVAKHGNYSVSSVCGSSNVLEYLGYQFLKDEGSINKEIDRYNLSFIHAPYFHPAMKSVVAIRKGLAIKTFFNILGPLINPAQPKYNFLGVFNPSLSRLYQYILKEQSRQFAVVYNVDGYDEISLTEQFLIRTENEEKLISPFDLGLPQYQQSQLYGGDDIVSNAKIFMNVLKNDCTQAQKDVVLANAGYAIHVKHQEKSILDCIALAKESIESGSALKNFKKILN